MCEMGGHQKIVKNYEEKSKVFFKYGKQIVLQHGLLLKAQRLIIPKSLREEIFLEFLFGIWRNRGYHKVD